MIDIKNIRHIIALYEVGTVTGAAERLHMSQPTLTSHLCRLEDKLGEPLFVRSARGLEPTLMGESLYRRGRQMLQQWTSFESEVELLAGAELGEIRLVCGAVIEQQILPSALIQFLKGHPRVNINVEVINPDRMLEHLLNDEADIAVGSFGDELSDEIESVLVGSQPIGFYARSGHPYLDGSQVEIDFQDIVLAAPLIPDKVYAWLKSKGFTADQHRVNSDNFDMLKRVAIESDLVVAGPSFVFTKEIADGRLHPLPMDERPLWTPSILIASAARHSKLANALVECMRSELVSRMNT